MSKDDGRLHIYLTHRRALVNYAAPIVGDSTRAEDVVQDAFTRFVSSQPSRTAPRLTQPLAYLYRIVRNLALDGRRQQKRESRHIVDDAAAAHAAPDETPSVETRLLLRQQARIVAAAIAELPERTRIALEMHRLEDAKLKDIATRLGISVALAHALIADGIAHCRQRLRRAG